MCRYWYTNIQLFYYHSLKKKSKCLPLLEVVKLFACFDSTDSPELGKAPSQFISYLKQICRNTVCPVDFRALYTELENLPGRLYKWFFGDFDASAALLTGCVMRRAHLHFSDFPLLLSSSKAI